MPTRPARSRTPLATCLAAVSLGALTALAQPAPDGKTDARPSAARPFPRGERPAGGFQPGGPGVGASRFLPMLDRVLTEDQRASLRTAMEEQRDKTRDIEEKLRAARRELLKASMVDKFNEDEVRGKALEVGRLDAELTVLRAKAFAQMKPALSADQIEQIKSPPSPEGGSQGPNPRRPGRAPAGPRDEHDLPLPPKAEK